MQRKKLFEYAQGQFIHVTNTYRNFFDKNNHLIIYKTLYIINRSP